MFHNRVTGNQMFRKKTSILARKHEEDGCPASVENTRYYKPINPGRHEDVSTFCLGYVREYGDNVFTSDYA